MTSKYQTLRGKSFKKKGRNGKVTNGCKVQATRERVESTQDDRELLQLQEEELYNGFRKKPKPNGEIPAYT
jgi:hypothetical protein